jgi:hypothetical protein
MTMRGATSRRWCGAILRALGVRLGTVLTTLVGLDALCAVSFFRPLVVWRWVGCVNEGEC